MRAVALLWVPFAAAACDHPEFPHACGPCHPMQGEHHAEHRVGDPDPGWCTDFLQPSAAEDGYDLGLTCWEAPRDCRLTYTFEQRRDAAAGAEPHLEEGDLYQASNPVHNIVVTESIVFTANRCAPWHDEVELLAERHLGSLAYRHSRPERGGDWGAGDDVYMSDRGVSWVVPLSGQGRRFVVDGQDGPDLDPGFEFWY